MQPTRFLLLALAIGVSAACGQKIGDSCTVSSDCSNNGTRVCDIYSPGGSCTIEGCDFGTCPDEAVCVRFFPALQTATMCTAENAATACLPDEVCTLAGRCAPRSIELRFCMLKCDGDGDCRDGYECRNEEVMKKHGGEPVPDPTAKPPEPGQNAPAPQPFCAARKPCVTDSDCEAGETCDFRSRLCEPASKPAASSN